MESSTKARQTKGGDESSSSSTSTEAVNNEDKCLLCYGPHLSDDGDGPSFELKDLKSILTKSFGIKFLPHFTRFGRVHMCTKCHEEFLKVETVYNEFVEVEKRFDEIRQKFSFAVVDSVFKSDYISNYVHGNAFDALRYLVFKEWSERFKKQPEYLKKSVSPPQQQENGKEEASISPPPPPQQQQENGKEEASISPPQQQVTGKEEASISPPQQQQQENGKEEASIPQKSSTIVVSADGQKLISASGNKLPANHKVIFVKRDPNTGKMVQVATPPLNGDALTLINDHLSGKVVTSPESRSSSGRRRLTKRIFDPSNWASGQEMDKLVNQYVKGGLKNKHSPKRARTDSRQKSFEEPSAEPSIEASTEGPDDDPKV